MWPGQADNKDLRNGFMEELMDMKSGRFNAAKDIVKVLYMIGD